MEDPVTEVDKPEQYKVSVRSKEKEYSLTYDYKDKVFKATVPTGVTYELLIDGRLDIVWGEKYFLTKPKQVETS